VPELSAGIYGGETSNGEYSDIHVKTGRENTNTDACLKKLGVILCTKSFEGSNPRCFSNSLLCCIEFDDQGEMWDRDQLMGTLESIKRYKTDGHPVTLIVFVHGWKNDASESCANLEHFHTFITNFARYFAIHERANNSHTKGRVVVGAYLSWRGNTYEYDDLPTRVITWLPKQISFYGRKRAAARVAGISCTETILSLAAMARITNAASLGTNDDSKIVIIGHSFGGLIVERAVSQAMMGEMLLNAPNVKNPNEIIKGLRDESNRHELCASNYLKAADALREQIRTNDLSTNSLTERIRSARIKFEERSNDVVRAGQHAGELWDKCDSRLGVARTDWHDLVALPHFRLDYVGISYGILEQLIIESGIPLDKARQTVDDLDMSAVEVKSSIIAQRHVVLSNAAVKLETIIAQCKERANTPSTLFVKALAAVQAKEKEINDQLTNAVFVDHEDGVRRKKSAEVDLRTAAGDLTIVLALLERANSNALNTRDLLHEELAGTNVLYWHEINEETKYDTEAENVPNRRELGPPPADLILLANPASEALSAKMMSQALRSPLVRDFTTLTNDNKPWIVSVSSPGDHATSRWFWAGRWLSSLFQSFHAYEHGKDSQRGYYTRTATHMRSMISHAINPSNTNSISTNLLEIISTNINPGLVGTNEFRIFTPKGTYEVQSIKDPEVEPSAYWVIQADRKLIPSHGAVFTPEFLSIASALYRISQRMPATNAPPASEPPVRPLQPGKDIGHSVLASDRLGEKERP